MRHNDRGNDIVDHILIEGWLPTLTEWEYPTYTPHRVRVSVSERSLTYRQSSVVTSSRFIGCLEYFHRVHSSINLCHDTVLFSLQFHDF